MKYIREKDLCLYYPNYMYHHGVKGMKWGIRKKYKPHPRKSKNKEELDEKKIKELREELDKRFSSNKQERDCYRNLTDEEILTEIEKKKKMRKALVASAAIVGVGAAAYLLYRHNATKSISDMIDASSGNIEKITKEQLDDVMKKSLDEVDFVLNPGEKLHRMVGFENFDLDKVKKPLYMSFKERDVDSYKALLRDWSGTGKRFDVTLEAIEEIKVPTLKKAKQIFDDLYNSNEEYRNELVKTLTDTYIDLRGLDRKTAEFFAKSEIKANPFSKGIYSIVRSEKDSEILINKFKEMGYDAIVDYFDKGSMAETPLIVFDPNKVLRKTGEKFVTRNDKIQSFMNLVMSQHVSVKDSGLLEVINDPSYGGGPNIAKAFKTGNMKIVGEFLDKIGLL